METPFFKNLEKSKILKETNDYLVSIDQREDEKFFVKTPLSTLGREMIIREFANQDFLFKLSMSKKDFGFVFLEPKLEKESLIFPDVSEKISWFGRLSSLASETRYKTKDLSLYLENFIDFEKRIHEVGFEDLPEFAKQDWENRKSRLSTNFSQDLKYCVDKNLFAKKDCNLFEKYFKNHFNNWAYQHHDVVPWHMGDVGAEKPLLVDSNWAGWSLKYYDFAYYALQMVGYANNKKDAEKLLEKAQKEFEEDENYRNVLLASIAYRGLKLTRELADEGGFSDSASKVRDFVMELFAKHGK